MRRTRLSLVVAGIVALCVATGAGASNPSHYLPGGAQDNITPQVMPAGASNATLTYILQLSGDPVTVQDANSKDAGNGPLSGPQKQNIVDQLKQQQQPVIQAAQQIGATVIASFQTVYNGIAVTIPARQAWQLSTINGVTGVFQAHTFTPATVAPGDGLPLINAPQAWDGTNGFHGEGLKVGDIDTGIDYTHADFGGSGNPLDYQSALSTDTAAPNPLFIGPTSETNIKGGIDLVGDNYDASGTGSQLVPQPDPNPLDCNSHGTHTAGTIAGQGVLQNGSTFTGPYNANTINSTDFAVPPGVAPKASLYSIRVFGCNGSVSDAVLLEAMDWAVQNGMDVINMSLGAPFGSASDPDSQAATNTAKDGVIVVSASGNNGNGPYITSSPGAGTGTLAAAAVDSTQSFPAADIAITGGPITAINANGATFSDGTTLPVKVLYSGTPHDAAHIALGCNESDYTSAGVSGDLVVVKRGTCARVARAIFGQQAGAAAVLMVNTSNAFPPFEGKITQDPDNGFQYNVTIPFLGVPSSNGATLVAADGTTATLTNDNITNPGYRGAASFSSFGPSAGGFMKPQVAAPGVSIASAGMGTGTGALIDSGTSMATPHTSGTAALVKQAHPNWKKVAYWNAAIVDTASASLVNGYSTRGEGAGIIQADKATQTQVVATSDPGNAETVNFGLSENDKAFTGNGNITLHNFGTTPATFNVADTSDGGDAHSVSFDHSTLTVPAGGNASVHMTLSVPSGGADPATSFNDWFGGGQFDDVAGLVAFTPASGSDNSGIALNVPYYGVPTLDSNTKVQFDPNQFTRKGASNTVNATVTNDHGATGFADWFSWGIKDSKASKKAGLGAADLLNVGVQTLPSFNFGLFALNTSKAWTNPAEEEFDVLVDVNGDGNPDYDVVAVDFGGLTTGSANGEDAVAVISLVTGSASIHYLAGGYFNGTTMELPFDFSQLCQASTPCISSSTPITYQVFSFDRSGGSDATDVSPRFNLFHPVFSNNLEDIVPAGSTATDPTTIDPTQWAATPQLGFLVLEQNNQAHDNHNETMTIPVSARFPGH